MIKRFIFALSIPVIILVNNCGGNQFELIKNPEIRTIGIPIRSVNWVRLHEGRDLEGNPRIYSTMGQNAENLFVLQIDPQTGDFRQFISDVPSANYPTATLMSRTKKLYVGAAYAGHLLCFDPDKDTLEDLGAINPGKATFPCAIDEDADGRIWIGSYGTADLTCYDPKTGTFTRHGRMDDVDMYNYPIVNVDGMICCKILMIHPHLLVFDPKTGKKKVVGPIATKNKDTFDLLRGPKGRVYIKSSLGNYRIEGFKAISVKSISDNVIERAERSPHTRLKDFNSKEIQFKPVSPSSKSKLSFTFTDDMNLIYRNLAVRTPDGKTRTFELNYKTAGNRIFSMHKGPDGYIYGSSYLPNHLYRYDSENDDLTDLGRCSFGDGEIYSMANYKGLMYISSYTGAKVSVYDPAKPYHYGDRPGDNPRELGRIDDISCRPRSTLAGPLGRIWIASIPDYGVWGGPLSYYDPKTEEKKAYYRIAGDGSCYTLAHLEKQELIAVGTSIHGGTGTRPKIDQAVLFLWDYKAEKKVWEGTLDRPVTTFNALLTAPDGRLFGTVTGGDRPELFVFDPESRAFTSSISLPRGIPRDLGLRNGPDGYIYGFTSSCFYRLDPVSPAIEEIVSEDDEFGVAGPILGNDVYYGKRHELKAIRLFQGE